MTGLEIAALMAAIVAAKSELIDRPKEQRQRKMEAAKARWSPWTGIAPDAIKEADPFGSALQGGLTGAMVGQMSGAQAKDLAEAQSVSGQNISLSGGQPLAPEEQQMTQPWYQTYQPGQNMSMESPYVTMARRRGY